MLALLLHSSNCFGVTEPELSILTENNCPPSARPKMSVLTAVPAANNKEKTSIIGTHRSGMRHLRDATSKQIRD